MADLHNHRMMNPAPGRRDVSNFNSFLLTQSEPYEINSYQSFLRLPYWPDQIMLDSGSKFSWLDSSGEASRGDAG